MLLFETSLLLLTIHSMVDSKLFTTPDCLEVPAVHSVDNCVTHQPYPWQGAAHSGLLGGINTSNHYTLAFKGQKFFLLGRL